MFERFAGDAREAVVHAGDEAVTLGAERIGSEHLLLGAVRTPDTVAARALAQLGIDHDRLLATVRALPSGALDGAALAGVGIDLDAVRAQVEAEFGAGALDDIAATPGRSGRRSFDPQAKKVLEIALREAVRLQHRRLDTGHLLLAVVRLDDTQAHRALASLGAGAPAVREAVSAAWATQPAARP